jgi:putative transposase
MRCALIEAEKASYPITWMCDRLGVARSSFYAGRAAAANMNTAARRLWVPKAGRGA